jgi:hypothetical protein
MSEREWRLITRVERSPYGKQGVWDEWLHHVELAGPEDLPERVIPAAEADQLREALREINHNLWLAEGRTDPQPYIKAALQIVERLFGDTPDE